jgi:nitrogen fixation/metabolism regulation signal transduction histidine kinase
MSPARRRPHALGFEQRIVLLALGAGLPGILATFWLLWSGEYPARVQWTVGAVVLTVWIGFAYALRDQVIRPLQTLSNLLSALREGDFSIRGREAQVDEPLGLAMLEINEIGELLRRQRLGAVEATNLLRTVMSEIDVAVFAIDGDDRVQLVNRAGERLLSRPAESVVGLPADELGLDACLTGPSSRIMDVSFAGGTGRWELRRGTFRQEGRSHQLVVLSNLTRTLRQEERQAWQRLVQVLRHEINNSLAPIKSLADSLRMLIKREPLPGDWSEDLQSGLTVISDRSGGLSRFMSSYARLTQLPAPEPAALQVDDWVQRVVALENRLQVTVVGGPDLLIAADGDQLDQLLINLVGNAVDAALETRGGVLIRWQRREGFTEQLVLDVEDDGPGLPPTQNLFVPFFTTKPQGSGIGLVLSRQIAEAHGGTLTLKNRPGAVGCRARLVLPLDAA